MTVGEFYGPAAETSLGDPATDPVLTVRVSPPDTQVRRLDLDTPRAVKVDQWTWVVTGTGDPGHFVHGSQVATWPVEHPISYGAAQRLARGHTTGNTGPAPALPPDEDERLFR